MRAYMSSPGPTYTGSFAHPDLRSLDTGDRSMIPVAQREVERILSETERPEPMFQIGTVAFHVSLASLNRDYVDDGALEAVALAEALARFDTLELS